MTVQPPEIDKTAYRMKRLQVIATIVHSLIRWTGGVLLAYLGYRSIDTLAHGATTADIGIRFFTDVRISTVLAWTVAAGGALYGQKERKLRRDTVERLSERIRILEAHIDPGRTTSMLTARGDTNPGDVI